MVRLRYVYRPLSDSLGMPYRRVIARMARGGWDHIYAALPEPLRNRNLKRLRPWLRPRYYPRNLVTIRAVKA